MGTESLYRSLVGVNVAGARGGAGCGDVAGLAGLARGGLAGGRECGAEGEHGGAGARGINPLGGGWFGSFGWPGWG